MKLRNLIVFLVLTGCLDKKVVVPATEWLAPPLKDLPDAVETAADPIGADDYYHQKLGTEEVWKNFTGSSTIKVAIVSTGIDYNHEDLMPRIYRNYDELKAVKYNENSMFNKKDDSGNGYADDFVGYNVLGTVPLPFDKIGQGTAAAGIIGAVFNNGKGVKGLCQNITILPIKAIDDDGGITVPAVVAGINYALRNNSDIILVQLSNMNLGDSQFSAMLGGQGGKMEETAMISAVEAAKKQNAIIVVNAGNMGAEMENSKSLVTLLSRESFRDHVVIVTSMDQTGRRPILANYGNVDLFAPYEATTTLPGNTYGKVKGTFVSASFVAGTLALALSSFDNRLDRSQIVRSLYEDVAADPVSPMEREYYETMSRVSLNSQKYLTYLSSLVQ